MSHSNVNFLRKSSRSGNVTRFQDSLFCHVANRNQMTAFELIELFQELNKIKKDYPHYLFVKSWPFVYQNPLWMEITEAQKEVVAGMIQLTRENPKLIFRFNSIIGDTLIDNRIWKINSNN